MLLRHSARHRMGQAWSAWEFHWRDETGDAGACCLNGTASWACEACITEPRSLALIGDSKRDEVASVLG